MMQEQDWLADPLVIIKDRGIDYLRPKDLDGEQASKWESFHYTTRLKLEAADHFCRQLLGTASMPDRLGFEGLAYKQLKWYLDVYFFELISAYDLLLQELNIIYAQALKLNPENITASAIKPSLPEKIVKYMEEGYKQPWFEKIRDYRNMSTHHSYIPVASWTGGFGDKPWHYSDHGVSIFYVDKAGNVINEDISQCSDYLCRLIEYISQVWTEMTEAFSAKETASDK